MISENVKLAREYALLGNYDSAMVYYQGVLDQMNKYLYSVRDTYLQQKWQQVNSTCLEHFVEKSIKVSYGKQKYEKYLHHSLVLLHIEVFVIM